MTAIQGVPFKLNAQDMGGIDLAQALGQGFQLGRMPQQLEQEAKARDFANMIAKVNAQYAEPKTLADIAHTQASTRGLDASTSLTPFRRALMEAQTQRAAQLAQNPYSGFAKDAFALEMLKRSQGEDSPVYQNAKKAFDMDLNAKQSLMDYRGTLSSTADKRASSSLGKLQAEAQEVAQGFMPGTGGSIRLSPEQQQNMLGQYQLQIQKSATDTQARQKSLLASNIDKTLETIDPYILTKYAGIKGSADRKKEAFKAALGRESEDYRKYKEAITSSEILAHQIRQFYGDSIQPSMTQAIQNLVNPAYWGNNPALAKRQFNQVKGILKKETGTYRGALKDTSEYSGASAHVDPLGLR